MDPQEESSSAAVRRELALYPRGDPDPEPKSDAIAESIPPPCYKTRPTSKVCKMHEVYFSSQYTRPATELLIEVLERYPAQETTEHVEEQPLVGGEQVGQRCGWVVTMMKYFGRAWHSRLGLSDRDGARLDESREEAASSSPSLF
ncbi:uncharacterized protein RCC_05768 [Ramularia collo-cygni]|uniref:Uncharacterized protein n=1 Tax=Ramularia collo-cygni TaxID=112498 RepID=A0A2D3URT1_9PEZI|nr:uncharacterized protein RCC_05768 [Ramularia collo-cygni]CZT19912.1 uncharacterized protein RCC_05768 [Ramularia collo-cygni]